MLAVERALVGGDVAAAMAPTGRMALAEKMTEEGVGERGEEVEVLEHLRRLHLTLKECSKRVDRVDVALQARPSLKPQSSTRDTPHSLTIVLNSPAQDDVAEKKCSESTFVCDSDSFEDIFTEDGMEIKDCPESELQMREEGGSTCILLNMWEGKKCDDKSDGEKSEDNGVRRGESDDDERMSWKERSGTDQGEGKGSEERDDKERRNESDCFQDEGMYITRKGPKEVNKRKQRGRLIKQQRLELDDSELNDMLSAGFVITPQLGDSTDLERLRRSSFLSAMDSDAWSPFWSETMENADAVNLAMDLPGKRLVAEEHSVAVSNDMMLVTSYTKKNGGSDKCVEPGFGNQMNTVSDTRLASQQDLLKAAETHEVGAQGLQGYQDDTPAAESESEPSKNVTRPPFQQSQLKHCETDDPQICAFDPNFSYDSTCSQHPQPFSDSTTLDNSKSRSPEVEPALVGYILSSTTTIKTVEKGTQVDGFSLLRSSEEPGCRVGEAARSGADIEMLSRTGTDTEMKRGEVTDFEMRARETPQRSHTDVEMRPKMNLDTWMQLTAYPDNKLKTFNFPQQETSWRGEVRSTLRSLVVALFLLLLLLVLASCLLLVVPVVTVSVSYHGGPPAF